MGQPVNLRMKVKYKHAKLDQSLSLQQKVRSLRTNKLISNKDKVLSEIWSFIEHDFGDMIH